MRNGEPPRDATYRYSEDARPSRRAGFIERDSPDSASVLREGPSSATCREWIWKDFCALPAALAVELGGLVKEAEALKHFIWRAVPRVLAAGQ